MVRFSDCFWESDFNSTAGYDCLIKRLKEGKKSCDDFIEFVRLRAKAEDDYGKTLIKISQNAGGSEEIGTMRASWDTLKRETENSGNAHCSAAQRLTDEIEKSMREFREKQKIERLKIDDKMKRMQKEKKSCYDIMAKSKRLYEQKCKESDAAKDALDAKSIFTPKEEERLRSRSAKAKTAAETSDTAYQHSVTTLEDTRQRWEKENELACNQFQTLEEERIKFLRNAMWVYANIGSCTAVNIDVMNEKMRMSLEKCDEVVDIQQFIKSRQTGAMRPASIPYENFYDLPNHESRFFQPSPANHDHHRRTTDVQPPVPVTGHKGPTGAKTGAYKPQEDEDRNYSSIQEIRPSGNAQSAAKMKKVRAAFDYEAQGEMELTLKQGDIVEILSYENEVWANGLLGNGTKGVFPLSYVEKA